MPKSGRTYLVNAWVDFLMMGGISILWWAWVAAAPSGTDFSWVDAVAPGLVWAFNWPHFSATNYRLYRSRETVMEYPFTSIAVPILLLFVIVVTLRTPMYFAPFLVKLATLWSTYHYRGQTLGLMLLYSRRSGFELGQWGRRLAAGAVFGIFFANVVRMETGTKENHFAGIFYPTLGLPDWTATVATVMMAVLVATFFGYLAIRIFRDRSKPPAILLLPMVSLFVWYDLGSRYFAFLAFLVVFHAMQYLLIAWVTQIRERTIEMKDGGAPDFILKESMYWVCINLGGALLLSVGLHELAIMFGYPPQYVPAVMISAVQIHHFFVDGVIWKLRRPSVHALVVERGFR